MMQTKLNNVNSADGINLAPKPLFYERSNTMKMKIYSVGVK